MFAKRENGALLRFRLYFGMLPVAALLIVVCLYTLYNYNHSNKRFELLQGEHYAAIRDVERLVLTTAQVERSILLLKEGEKAIARRGYNRSIDVLQEWLDEQPYGDDQAQGESDERTFYLYMRNLVSLAQAAFDGSARVYPVQAKFGQLMQQLEEVGLRLISKHNTAISSGAQELRRQSTQHFYIVITAIVSSVFLMGYVAYSLSQRILAPIDALTEVASRLGSGDEEIEYIPSSRDEIARLEHAFVEMKDRIREYKRVTGRQIVRTRRRMEECLNNLPYPVLFLNSSREIAYMNPAARELVDEDGLWSETIEPQLRGRIDQVFGTGEEVFVTDFDEMVSAKLGLQMVHYLPIVVRIDSEDVGGIECGIVLQDVTQLRLSDELKSDLVATVSHEIKTPVTSAMMALHLVLEKAIGDLTQDQEDMIQTAVGDLNRLKRLLEHLLEIARLESKAPRLYREEVSPSVLVHAVEDGFVMSAQSKGIRFLVSIDHDLPSVQVDQKALEVGLSNFVSNAIKYSPEGSTIELYAEKRDRYVRFGVRDEGPGMAEEDVEKVFEKFYRSNRYSKLDGVGLGLSIVKEIALAHDGSTGCILREPLGCDFYLEVQAQA